MPHQPDFSDKQSWKKISDTGMFFSGWTLFLFWLFNTYLRPARFMVPRGHEMVYMPPALEPAHIPPWAAFTLHNVFLLLAVPLLGLSVSSFLNARAAARDQRIVRRQQNYSTTPPWHQLVMAGIALVFGFAALSVGLNYDWIADVFVLGPCAFIFLLGLQFAFFFVTDSVDQARARGDYGEEDE